MSFHEPPFHGSFATAQLPNKSGAVVQTPTLRVGHTAYDFTVGALVYCTLATAGAATWSYVSAGGAASGGLTLLHDTTHAPVGLWQLSSSGVYTDSGTSGTTLVLGAGTDYTSPGPAPNAGAFTFDGATRVASAATAPASLRILTSVTVEALVRPGNGTTVGVIAHVSGDMASETEANNALWELRFSSQTTLEIAAFWEHGAGVNDTIAGTPPYSLNRFMWHHLAMVRDTTGGVGATSAKLYVNGFLIASTSTLSPPTGGTTSNVRIGGGNIASTFVTGGIASVKVVAAALSQTQIQDEVRRTIAPQNWLF